MQKILATSSRGYGEARPIEMLPDLNRGDDVIRFKTVIIELPGPTRNGVLYPLDQFKKAVNDPRVQQMLKTGAFYGESDHPINPEDLNRWCRIEMTNATHKWTRLWFENNVLWGECQTYAGNGNLLGLAIKGGELPSFSIRVIGNPSQSGEYTELNDIQLLSIDWVRYPGNPTSYVPTSDEFNFEKVPLYTGFDLATRQVGKAEAAETLGIRDNQAIYSMGEGFYSITDRITNLQEKEIINIRRNSF